MEIVRVPDVARDNVRPNNVIVIGVDGNISSLKTTTLSLIDAESESYLSRGIKLHVLYEKIPSIETLGDFYTVPKNAKELELAFQRLKIHQLHAEVEACKQDIANDGEMKHIILMDRTVYGNYAFTLNNYISGNLKFDEEMELTEQFFVNEEFYSPDYIVYLRTPAEQCLKFCKTRDNDYERNMKLDYLQGVERIHDIMFDAGDIDTKVLADDKMTLDVSQGETDDTIFRVLSTTSKLFGKRASGGEYIRTESGSTIIDYLRGFVFRLYKARIYRLVFDKESMTYKPAFVSVVEDIIKRNNW